MNIQEGSDGLSSNPLAVPSMWQPRPPGAPVSVLFLRRDGIKLSKEEIVAAGAIVGEMSICRFLRNDKSTVTMEACIFKRGPNEIRTSLHKSLFDPQVISMDSRGIAFRGHEREIIEGRIIEFVQVWLVRPTVSCQGI